MIEIKLSIFKLTKSNKVYKRKIVLILTIFFGFISTIVGQEISRLFNKQNFKYILK